MNDPGLQGLAFDDSEWFAMLEKLQNLTQEQVRQLLPQVLNKLMYADLMPFLSDPLVLQGIKKAIKQPQRQADAARLYQEYREKIPLKPSGAVLRLLLLHIPGPMVPPEYAVNLQEEARLAGIELDTALWGLTAPAEEKHS